MKKVIQTVCDPGKGNCMQAVIASLFEKEMDEVPDFINLGKEWFTAMTQFYRDNGYPEGLMCFDPNERLELVKEVLEYDGGVNGYWSATVPSQTFPNVMHAVVIDKNMNIVHDPNPNQKALALGPKDIVQIDTVKQDWYITTEGNFKKATSTWKD
jgi:hypothetical protein